MWTGERSSEASAARLRSCASALFGSRWLLCVWILLWTGVGGAYVVAVKPDFIARTDVMLEPQHISNDGPEDLRHYHQFALDSEKAETELRVLRSEGLLRPVFHQLQLENDPELTTGHNGFWSQLAHVLHRLSPTAPSYDAESRAFYAFADRVRCLRLGLSYVIEISYRSGDPIRAARVTNAVAAAYVNDRLVRLQTIIQRGGGPYRAARGDAIFAQIAETGAAIRDGSPLTGSGAYGDVRFLGSATPPLVKAYPKSVLTIFFTMVLGAISGAVLVIFVRASPSARCRKVS